MQFLHFKVVNPTKFDHFWSLTLIFIFVNFEIVNPKFPFLVLQKNRVLKSLTLAKKLILQKNRVLKSLTLAKFAIWNRKP